MTEHERPARTRRRGEELLTAIRAAVLAEVAETGLGRLTMEGIAKRAGTAKTSLYRRWSSPQEVLLDAIHAEHPQETVSPGSDDLRGDLIRALRQLVDWMRSPSAEAAGSIVAERVRHPELARALYERVFEPRGGRFTLTVLRHYAEQGRIDPRLITPVVADIGEALVFKYAMDTHQVPDDAKLAEIVDQAVLPAVGIGPDRPESAAKP
ncbi:TetR/AcrR family transcriptional regulator [Allonocardiopsis opalescens]|uniref:TetR family transcriptional regulator n=1 Tax=Allonocardiopsis opalescens TaxID=1144618 RepID=A0A2T0Q738_9ACTN|nr:TetR/AcrR family transcriptional regulator [Allonocardiopsis opalescens]PRX99533.1 TetR family transcriptional regulator [Allonocardiopsis opalescens]